MIEGVTPDQFKIIMNKVKKEHRLIEGHCVKYVNTSFDFRDCTFWRFVFRGFGPIHTKFTTANRNSYVDGVFEEAQGSLFDEIMLWLNEGAPVPK